MKRKILLLYNPSSGLNGNGKRVLDAVRILAEYNCEVTVYPIVPSHKLTSESILKGAEVAYESILVIGGDGTMNHVINTMMQENIHVPIGYIPAGSTNDFSHTLYQDTVKPEDICRYIAEKRAIRYDIGRFNNTYFNYVAAFGAFSKVSYATPQDMKNTMGYAAYVLSFLASIPEDINFQRHVRVVCDGIAWEGSVMLGAVSNSSSVAGIRLASLKDTSIDDGLLELTLIPPLTTPLDLTELAGSILGGTQDEKHIRSFRGRHIELYFDQETLWTLDGEEGMPVTDIVIDAIPEAITIYAPDLR